MAELESIRDLIADTLDGLADAMLAEPVEVTHDELQTGYRLWHGADTLRWVEERETGPSRVIELEDEVERLENELDDVKADAASVGALETEVGELKAKVKELETALRRRSEGGTT